MGESAVSCGCPITSRSLACSPCNTLSSPPLPMPQYSFGLTTFSPSGKLIQIEHALTAVNAGATSLGIRACNGVVLATEKKLPSILVDETTVQKISLCTPNVGMTYSGMGPDSRVLVRKARKSGQVYYRQYHEQIPVAQLCRETAAVMQEFTRERGWWGRGRQPWWQLAAPSCCSAHGAGKARSLSHLLPACPACAQNLAACGPLACR